jgi:hypothetical protein
VARWEIEGFVEYGKDERVLDHSQVQKWAGSPEYVNVSDVCLCHAAGKKRIAWVSRGTAR